MRIPVKRWCITALYKNRGGGDRYDSNEKRENKRSHDLKFISTRTPIQVKSSVLLALDGGR
jgi:hypothetical protein